MKIVGCVCVCVGDKGFPYQGPGHASILCHLGVGISKNINGTE